MKVVKAESNKRDIIQDLPTNKDFDRYLTSLENIISFCMKHKIYVDVNLQFGLFLTKCKSACLCSFYYNHIPTSSIYIKIRTFILLGVEFWQISHI